MTCTGRKKETKCALAMLWNLHCNGMHREAETKCATMYFSSALVGDCDNVYEKKKRLFIKLIICLQLNAQT